MRTYLSIFLATSMLVTSATSAAEVVFKDKSGRTLTKEDIHNASGPFNWEILAGMPIPEEAKNLHELGRSAGQRGKNKMAIEQFEKAAKLAPNWPYPLYDAAYTYLIMGDFGKAYELYKRVDELAPRGFFTAKTAVHSLRGEINGEFPKGTYLYFLSIEWASDTAKKLQIVNQLVAKVPFFAPGWKAKAALEDDNEKRLAYIETGLKAHPDLETRGFLLINQALALHMNGRKKEAIQILGKLALDPTSPRDIEAIAKKSIAMIVAR